MKTIIKSILYRIRFVLHFVDYKINHNHISVTNRIAENVSLKKCHIGTNNYIGRRCSFYKVKIGNYCCFGPDIHIGGMQHSYWWYSMSPILSDKCVEPERTIIGNDVWIGASCVIKQGVKIGNGAVVGANSFVNKDVPPFAIVAGSPAKIIKYRFGEDIQSIITNSRYWDLPPQQARNVLMKLPKHITNNSD